MSLWKESLERYRKIASLDPSKITPKDMSDSCMACGSANLDVPPCPICSSYSVKSKDSCKNEKGELCPFHTYAVEKNMKWKTCLHKTSPVSLSMKAFCEGNFDEWKEHIDVIIRIIEEVEKGGNMDEWKE